MFRKWIKRIFIFVAVILFLVIALIMFIHTPWGRNIVRNQAERFLSKTLNTRVSIGDIDYRLPNWIQLKRLVVLDQKNDTLLSGGNIYVKINMLQLLNNKVEVRAAELENIAFHINRNAGDTTFNYQFVEDAFSTGPPKPENTDTTSTGSKPIQLDVRSVLLNQISFNLDDYHAKQHYRAGIPYLLCKPGKLDLEYGLFELKELTTSGTYFEILDSTAPKTNLPVQNNTGDQPIDTTLITATTPSPLSIFSQKLGLKNIHFSYRKPLAKYYIDARLDELQADSLSVDVIKQAISCRKINLDRSKFCYSEWSPPAPGTNKSEPVQTNSGNKEGWKISVNNLDLADNSFSYHNEAVATVKGFDPNHIDAEGINFSSKQNLFDNGNLSSTIDRASVLVNHRYRLKNLHSEFQLKDGEILVKDPQIEYNNSRLLVKGDIHWPGTNMSATGNSTTHIENTVISFGDVLDLYPGLQDLIPLNLSPDEKLTLTASITGPPQNFTMQDVQLNSARFRFSGNAAFQNSNRKNDPVYQASIKELVVQKDLLSPSLLNELKKQQISIPEKIALAGTVRGDADNILTDVRMNSSYGQLNIKGNASHFSNTSQMQYNLQLHATGLETGKWIGDETMPGKLNGNISVKGQGIDPAKMQLTTNSKINSIIIDGYKYTNIDLTGHMDHGTFATEVNINDPNLVTSLQLKGAGINEYPTVSGTANIKKADFKNLGFLTDTMIFSGIVNIDTLNTHPNNFIASAGITNGNLFTGGKNISVDTVEVKAYSDQNGTNTELNSSFIQAKINSSFPIESLPRELQNAIDAQLGENVNKTNRHGWFTIDAQLQQDSLLKVFVPALKMEKPVTIQGRFGNSKEDSLHLEAKAPLLFYNNIGASNLLVRVNNSGADKLFTMEAGRIFTGSDSIYQPMISGSFRDSSLSFSATTADIYQKQAYAVGASVVFGKAATKISLADELTIHYDKWKVPSTNQFTILKEGIVTKDFSLSRPGHIIEINTESSNVISPIHIKADSLDLGVLATIASIGDTSIAQGKLNIDVTVQQPLTAFPVFTGRAAMYNLGFEGIPVGNLELNSKSSGDSLVLDGTLTGVNKAVFNGSIHPQSGALSLDASLQQFNLDVLQVFLKDYIPRSYGILKADLQFRGNVDNPTCKGTIYLDSTGLALTELNTLYKINNQQITIDFPDVLFNDFIVTDTSGNRLTISGAIKVNSPTDYGLNLQTKTKNFVALNSRRLPGSMIYGKGIVDGDVTISGSSMEPSVKGNIALLGGSDIHYIINQSKTYTKGNERIRFVDIDTVPLPGTDTLVAMDTIRIPKTFRGLTYNLNLDISKEAEFSILIDPKTGDELMISGQAQLNTGIDEDGQLGITGVYQLQSGYYKMNNQILKGKFLLVKGSTITFNGDPYAAIADIKTEYEVKTSLTGLLNENDSKKQGASESYRFMIVLNVKGPLSKPILTFDIRMKQELTGSGSSLQTSIDNELEKLRQDVSAMNKQIFSLLVLNQFTVYSSTDMASSDLSPDVMLRQGMSQFLNEAMNEVASNLIKGVDVNINFNNYKDKTSSTGNTTEMGVSLSKNLANERLTVTVGKNFTVGETTQATYAKSTDQYIPDITTTYRLSKDGRYYVKAYRRNEYDAVVEGYFAKTGVSFTIQMDYEHFRQLFTRAKKLEQNP